MDKFQKDYNRLHQIGKEARTLVGISSILSWDQETYMPQGGAENRGEELKLLAGLIHTRKTNKQFSGALSKLIDIPSGKIIATTLADAQKAALREWRRDYTKAKALPKSFVANFAKLTSQSILAWRDAKKDNNFKAFAPYLKKLVDMSRKKADYFGYQEHPYDALIDEYEPNVTTREITEVFSSLRDSVTGLLKKVSHKQPIDDSIIHGTFPHDKQIEFSKKILLDMGYGDEFGRVDLSAHPFSSASHPTDSRITTRFHPTSLMSCISVILHEAGHALYEMGLPADQFGTPLGDALSLGMHESQSRWWETRIGQSKTFWKHYLPKLKEHFGGKLEHVSLDHFYKAINKVEPSMIRVEADEVTYSLHVILRFELEKALIEGTLAVKDIPEAWNEKMQEMLGITPKTYAEGCLQDIHWSMGSFGYFPTYTLGNLYASHLFEAFERVYPDWEMRVAKGELLFIKTWLNDNIHAHGRRYSSLDLLKNVTGKPFTSDAFSKYLLGKYSDIYGLN